MSVGIDSHQLEKDGEGLNKKVTQEMFDSITREVVEETGIPASSLVSYKDSFCVVSLKEYLVGMLSDPSFIQFAEHSSLYWNISEGVECEASYVFLHQV